ncbi:Protein kinase domain, partial [Dillenia turbinata]
EHAVAAVALALALALALGCGGPTALCEQQIGYLLNALPSQIASLNNVSNVYPIPADSPPVVVPMVNCSCTGDGQFYQHNPTYVLKTTSETYFTVANDTYQGLSTCQAMKTENPGKDYRNLEVGMSLRVPLRCAYPTQNQTVAGVKFLLTYLTFGVEEQSVLDANQLSPKSVIFPFTPILVPLKSPPTKIHHNASSLSPPPPSPSESQGEGQSPPDSNSSSSNKWIFVGVGIGGAVLILFILAALYLFPPFCRRRRPSRSKLGDTTPKPRSVGGVTTTDWSVVSSHSQYAVESMTLYKYEELREATGSFGEANRIKGSVYLGWFKGDKAAVKITKGDISDSKEIAILKQINHTNIIRLSGFCVHQGHTYLVYEDAENGSLSDWLHHPQTSLSWKQRVQIAHDVANALNYLHNYASPPYVHKNLKTSSILLDGYLRAKVANLSLARTLDQQEGGLRLTRHVIGIQGYMAPEYVENGMITPELDVFAFGVVLLELLSGREAANTCKSPNPKSRQQQGGEEQQEELLSATIKKVVGGENIWEKLRGFIDPCLGNQCPLDLAFSVAQLANNCVAHDLNSRPTMSEVFLVLSKVLSSSMDWDPSEELDRSRSLSHGR